MNTSVMEVLERLDAAELVGKYITLQRSGKSLKALCPFHAEKTPSFHLDPDKKLWYCFGCGKGGNLLDFYKEIEKVDFREALTALAEQTGVTVLESGTAARGRKELYELLEEAARFYAANCESEVFQRFLKERGLNEETAERFGLGLAWGEASLLRHLQQKGFSREAILMSGLMLKHGRQLKERFRERIMIPLHSPSGRIVGFAGRSLSPANTPKYLNTQESPIFKKGELVYGFHQASTEIRKTGKVILVEGYADVWQCFQKGFPVAVAAMGTSLTAPQVKILSRFAETLYFCFDGDKAGLRSMCRSFNLFFENRMEVRVVRLPDGKDPDDLLREGDREGFQSILEQAVPFYRFYVDYLCEMYPPSSLEKRAHLKDELKLFLGSLREPMLADEVLEYAEQKTKLKKADILIIPSQERRMERKPLLRGLEKVEVRALLGLFTPFARLVRERLAVEDFSLPVFREIVECAFKNLASSDSGQKLKPQVLMAHLSREARVLLSRFYMESDLPDQAELEAALSKLEAARAKKKQTELKELIARRLKEKDTEGAAQLFERYISLKKASFY